MAHKHRIWFIRDDYNRAYRVWSNRDAGDQFLMLPYNQDIHTNIKKLCEYHNHLLTLGDPQED